MAGLIYLIRHGEPAFLQGQKLCLGNRSDPPLSEEGVRQAKTLKSCFLRDEAVYCSPMLRCLQTAKYIFGREPVKNPELAEMDMGRWDGLTFHEIRESYPETYARRGLDWSLPASGGECLEDAARRAQKAILGISDEEAAVVTHEGIIRALLWKIKSIDSKAAPIPRYPYGSITVLKIESGKLTVTAEGVLPEAFPDDSEICEILKICRTPDEVIRHCEAVCAAADELCAKLSKAGLRLSRGQLRAAAKLHDMCRTIGAGHPKAAARILRERGYMKIAYMIEHHHDIWENDQLDEGQILFLADKLVLGSRRVTLEERFEESLKKCRTAEALKKHTERKEKAFRIDRKISQHLGGNVQ